MAKASRFRGLSGKTVPARLRKSEPDWRYMRDRVRYPEFIARQLADDGAFAYVAAEIRSGIRAWLQERSRGA